MISSLLILTLAVVSLLVYNSRTRSAKLARLAKHMGCGFLREKDSLTTPLTAGRLEFFTQFFHQYQNVFTLENNVAFIRISDDNIFTDDNPTTHPIKLTVFTAEFKKKQFPALKLAPAKSPFGESQYMLVKTNIPAVDVRYELHAPSAASSILFTPFIVGLLKTHSNLYLEINDNAIIYHEHTLIPAEKMEEFRFRALQILGEFENLINHLEEVPPHATATLTPKTLSKETQAEMKAEAMLKALAVGRETPEIKKPNKSLWLFLILFFMAVMSLLSWYFVNQLPNR